VPSCFAERDACSAMDVTDKYTHYCQKVAEALGRGPYSPLAWTPTTSCLPPALERSPFQQAAFRLYSHIYSATEYINQNRRDLIQVGRYVAASTTLVSAGLHHSPPHVVTCCRVSASDRSQIEADMLKLLRGCEMGLKQLQDTVATQKAQSGGPTATQVAHCHGLVRHILLETWAV
jgi:hypothetical protein